MGELDGLPGDNPVLYGTADENDSGAYIIYGGPEMNLGCYDRAVFIPNLGGTAPTTAIAASIIDAGGTAPDELLLMTKDGAGYHVAIASGTGDALEPLLDAGLAKGDTFASDWGALEPAFITGCPKTIAFGGEKGPYGSALVPEIGSITSVKPMGTMDGTAALSFTDLVENMWQDLGPRHDLLVGGKQQLNALMCPLPDTMSPNQPYMPIPGFKTFSESRPRTINPYHRYLRATMATSQTMTSYDIIGYTDAGFSRGRLENSPAENVLGGATQVHESLGQIVATGNQFDLIALLKSTDEKRRLRIFTELTVADADAGFTFKTIIEGVIDRTDVDYVAVGDFFASGHDDILLVARSTPDAFVTRYSVITDGDKRCAVPSGTETCP
ncbi:hypothetical protein BH11MYX2_BH11MYX2_03980 [soil metagenome]